MLANELKSGPYMVGQSTYYQWNKKLCLSARDALYECQDAQENKNKFRCPDELYAYDKWCPADFQKVNAHRRAEKQVDEATIDQAWLDRLNYEKQVPSGENYAYQ